MKIVRGLSSFSSQKNPIALTIGNFDGVHLGHQALIKRLKELAPSSAIFTFENHPTAFLKQISIPLLTTLPHRLALFEQLKVDLTVTTAFTHQFAQQTAKDFLTTLKQHLPFSYLVLGYDAHIGSDKKSDLSDLCDELGFKLEYLEPVYKNGKIVSSSRIRKSIQEGELLEVNQLLGRPYSIFARVEQGAGKGKSLGFHTANLAVHDLILPPFGVYAVEVRIDHKTTALGIANLGYAPTLHQDRPPCLEVHLFDTNQDLYGKELEVFFLQFIRPESKFESVDTLKSQIQKDISFCKSLDFKN